MQIAEHNANLVEINFWYADSDFKLSVCMLIDATSPKQCFISIFFVVYKLLDVLHN